jgi:DNA-binding SARP family transcriptional activator
MTLIKVNLFGKFSARRAEHSLDGLDVFRTQELFTYLLVNRDRPHTREALATLLWGETPTEKAKKYLRQTLWHLQTALDAPDAGPGHSLLMAEHDWVQLNLSAELRLDVADFEQAHAQARGVSGRGLCAEQFAVMQSAATLYTGDLLEGSYQDWCMYERERLQNMYLMLLDKLLGYCVAHQDYEAGRFYGGLLLRQDRAHERTHRQLMRLHYRAGDRTAALRQHERCRVALREELGVEPDRRTAALCEQIRADRLAAPSAPNAPPRDADEPAEPEGPGESLPDVLTHLRQLQSVLDDTQRRVRREIKAVELSLRQRTQRILNR